MSSSLGLDYIDRSPHESLSMSCYYGNDNNDSCLFFTQKCNYMLLWFLDVFFSMRCFTTCFPDCVIVYVLLYLARTCR